MADVDKQIEIPTGLNRKERRALKRGLLGIVPKGTIIVPRKSRITELDILEDAFSAAICRTSIEIIASQSEDHSPDRVIANLNRLLLEIIVSLMIKNAERIAWQLRSTRRTKFAVAFDFTAVMYYGVDKKGNPFVTGTKPKNGTYYAFRFFAISITTDGARFILYSCPVTKETDGALMYVELGIELLQRLGLDISVLTLDREFYSAGVINYLQEKHINFIIPVPQTDRFKREVKKRTKFPEKLPALVRFWKIGDKYKGEAETTLVILEEEDEKTKKKNVYGYVTDLPWDFYQSRPHILSELYSKRWGIETAFRVEDKFDIYTTTRNGTLRHFFFLVSCILYNLWVKINFISQARKVDNGSFEIIVKVDELRIVLIHLFNYKLRRQKFNKICELLAAVIDENTIGCFLCSFWKSGQGEARKLVNNMNPQRSSPPNFSSKSWKAL